MVKIPIQRQKFADIENTRIKTETGEEFPLHELADYTINRGKIKTIILMVKKKLN